ncbi:BRO1-domain-containing protein [Neolentinus lepideus HHB14362 ss-1]|uniref:BRO domain-containing protein 1 n=1 Tax=Neolentinus lepideus HHB14362 ss-1 TaxID=1314782 RepID=A0A165T5C9_9AGAM|nr:BRO1-domain-containing protein [Neolentinus lepideus HHB14362 ss-1]
MAHQSPMLAIPKKSTDEVDWTTPIRNIIAQSYGESPDNYAAECSALQRCRQDAVRGAGSDLTARDLLYKYFGQLELLELRFSEIRVNFPWRDAFTNKLTVQTSIAYEKASIIFQIAATHSAIAASQNRSDPEGLKRAFHYFRTCAGMLTYINDNFLHAPSTDLSREVIKFLVNIILAQATEVFFEKCRDERKGNALISKVASQTSFMYSSLAEEVKEFMGKGIFDRNWVTLIQIKSKYFTSVCQYYRGLADHAASKHGDALVRFTVAETNAKDAQRLSATFDSVFVTQMSPTLPPDAGPSIRDLTKAHFAVCSDRKAEAQRDNDLIYNDVLPSPEALPSIDKTAVATPIPIQDVYSTPDVQKVIGPDLFTKLIPLSVHESASVYSEEKAKLVRAEVENTESAEVEVRSALEALGVKEGLVRYRAIVEGGVGGEEEIPVEVRRWREDIGVMEDREPVEGLMRDLNKLKDSVKRELEVTSRDLEIESKDCEMMRVKYEHLWMQEPSAGLTKTLRQDLKSHFEALQAAASSDQQVVALWDAVRSDILLLLSPELEDVFRASTEGGAGGESLLDLDIGNDAQDSNERVKIGQFVEEIDERLGRLNKISRERNEVLKDLKEKVQNDDVSHLLLVNRRNAGVEPTLFAVELEKFRPYQQRLSATVHAQQVVIQEITQLWKGLKDLAVRGPGARKWEEREKRKKDTVKRFSRARDVYMEARDGLAKGLQFYRELTGLVSQLKRSVSEFVSSRTTERERLAGQLDTQRRLSSSSGSNTAPSLPEKPPRPPPPPSSSLESSFAAMGINKNGPTSPPPSSGAPWNGANSPPPPNQCSYNNPPPSSSSQYPSSPPQPSAPSPYTSQPSAPSSYPPPPLSGPHQPQTNYASAPPDPYASLGMFSSQFSAPPPPPPQRQPQSPYGQSYQSPPPPPQQPHYASSQPPQPQYGQPPQPYSHQQPPSSRSSLPPPPPPLSYQSQYNVPSPSAPYSNGVPGSQPPYGQYQQNYGR